MFWINTISKLEDIDATSTMTIEQKSDELSILQEQNEQQRKKLQMSIKSLKNFK